MARRGPGEVFQGLFDIDSRLAKMLATVIVEASISLAH